MQSLRSMKSKKRAARHTRPPAAVTGSPARSGDKELSDAPSPSSDGSTVVWPGDEHPHGPTPGALRGDDYQLDTTLTAIQSCRRVWTVGQSRWGRRLMRPGTIPGLWRGRAPGLTFPRLCLKLVEEAVDCAVLYRLGKYDPGSIGIDSLRFSPESRARRTKSHSARNYALLGRRCIR